MMRLHTRCPPIYTTQEAESQSDPAQKKCPMKLQGSKTISLRFWIIQISLEDYLEDPSTLFDNRGSLVRIIIIMKKIPVCHQS